MTKRVLFWSLLARWEVHTALEAVWMHALRNAGADVRMIVCDGVFRACDVHRTSIGSRGPLACQECQAGTFANLTRLGHQWEGMNAYVPRPVRAEARAWVEAVPAEQLFAARWRGQPVGEWASSSALNHFRLYVPDFADPRFVRAAREVLEATVLSYEAALVVFDEHQPEVVVVMNGRFAPQRVIVEVARQRGARIITHERGAQDDTHRVVDGALIHDLGEYDRLAADWQPLALRASQLHRIDLILEQRRWGRNFNWVPFSPPPQDAAGLRSRLRLDDRPLVVCFTSSDDELASMPEWSEGAFPRSLDWLPATLALAARRPELQFVIRVHPNLARMGANPKALAQVQALGGQMPDNCRMVGPTEDISTYTLVDLADAVVIYCSTVGLEAAVAGKPVVAVARGWYGDAPWLRRAIQPEDYEPLVLQAVATKPSREVARLALRMAYHRFETQHFHLMIKRLVNSGGEAELSITVPPHVEGEARNPLAQLTALVLEGRSHIRRPDAADLARGTADEDTFLINRRPELWPELAPLRAEVEAGRAKLSAGDPAGALRAVMAVTQREPRLASAWLALAEVFLALARPSGAIDAWGRALKVDLACRPALLGLIGEARGRGDRAAMAHARDRLRLVIPDDPALAALDAELLEAGRRA